LIDWLDQSAGVDETIFSKSLQKSLTTVLARAEAIGQH
jgi:hypothetical protein